MQQTIEMRGIFMKVNKALIHIAVAHVTSVTEVRRDIQKALDEGWNNSDPKVQEYWRKIPSRCEKPTLEEVIEFMAKENLENLYYTCDNYTDTERILCVHGFQSELYVNDVSVIFNKKAAPSVKAMAIPISEENYKIVQMKKNLDAYLAPKTP